MTLIEFLENQIIDSKKAKELHLNEIRCDREREIWFDGRCSAFQETLDFIEDTFKDLLIKEGTWQ